MKHIKIFEDYSDEEIRDLQDDLHGIGHKSKFVLGEDFGFGTDLGKEWHYNYPTITKEMVNFLLTKGEIKKVPPQEEGDPEVDAFYFQSPEKWGMNSDEEEPTYPEITPSKRKDFYFIDYNADNESPGSEYDEIMKKLGEIRI